MLAIGLAAVLFAVSNRGSVQVDFWPLPVVREIPLFLMVLAAALIGFIGGAIVAWFSGGRTRQRARRARRQVTGMEKDLHNLQDKIGDLEDRQKRPITEG